MKQIVVGLAILFILFMGGVMAESTDSAILTTSTEDQIWKLDSESAAAMIELYAADIRLIEDGYGALILNDTSEIDDFMVYTQDPDGTIDALIITIQNVTNKNESATAEMARLYDAYDSVNVTGHQMLSSFDTDEHVPVQEEIIAYKDASVNLTQVFDRIVTTYIDTGTLDEKSFTLLVYTNLLNAVILEDGFILTADPVLQDMYNEKMTSFDSYAELFKAQFPDSSIDDIIELKQKANDVVQETIVNNDGEIDTSALIPVVVEIMDRYHQISAL